MMIPRPAAVKAPWLNNYGDVAPHLDYFTGTMAEAVEEAARQYPDVIAYDFLGSSTSYKKAVEDIHRCAKGLVALGIKPGDRVTVCMPNAPQTVTVFYAINLIGAVANMVHPLSAVNEIAFCINDSQSVAAITLDQFYYKFKEVRRQAKLPHLILTSIGDALSPVMKLGYRLTQGRDIKKPDGADFIWWKDMLKNGASVTDYRCDMDADAPAAILYSGGTTGTMKGIYLSSMNFNALAKQVIATNTFFRPGDKMLAIMPMFHGFGLGVSIHTMLASGGHCILVPRFTPKSYAELLKKHRPNLIAGVPSLFEALLRVPEADKLELSCLKGVFSGGDSLSVELKKRFDKFLCDHGASVQVREGYGTTECVTASCLTPLHLAKEGSIGQPFPDTYYKIVAPGTTDEVPYDTEGEICLTGPTMMLGYVNHPEETASTMRVHADGLTWVHTGDLGMMDEDGFIYFRQRIKRMIITNGYNVYPSQIENTLESHESVHLACVIGVKDDIRMQRVKAFVMLKPGFEPSDALRADILAHCEKSVAKYAMPKELEFRPELPKTLVGKVAYRVLEEEEAKKENDKA